MSKREDRPHQKAAIKDCVAGFKKHKRGQVIMACGTGKTHVGMRVAEVLKSKRVIVFVPSVALVAQFIRNWREFSNAEYRMLAVCGDRTVSAGADAEDDISAAQLAEETGIDVTTDPDVVASFLRGHVPSVLFCTYASSGVIEVAQQRTKVPALDLAICDEAHRCASHVNGPWCTIVREGSIRVTKRLFMTATPRIFQIPTRDDGEDAEIVAASMDDVALFGPVFHRLGFAMAIKLGLLCDYRVVVTVVTNSEVAALIRAQRSIAVGDARFDAKTLATHVAVCKAVHEHTLCKLLSFHSRIYKAKDFARRHVLAVTMMQPANSTASQKLWVNHVSAGYSSQERLRILEEFARQPKSCSALLTNARCLTEGVDVPTVDGIVFADPRESVVAITQAIGRAMRLAPGKSKGTIIVPVFVDDSVAQRLPDGTVSESVFDDSAFQTVRRVITALRMADDELGVLFSRLSARAERNASVSAGGSNVYPRYVPQDEVSAGVAAGTMVEATEDENVGLTNRLGRVYDKNGREVVVPIPERIQIRGAAGIPDEAMFASSICNRVVRWSTPTAEQMASAIVRFIEINGREPSIRSKSRRERLLCVWAQRLRKKGRDAGYDD